MSPPVPMVVVTGPVGVGKTAVASAISDLLDRAGVAHAMVDADHLRWCYPRDPRDPFRVALGLRNLAAVWANYRDAGAGRLVLADVVESPAGLAGYRAAIPGAAIVVVRLQAPLPTIARRLAGRETGASLDWHRRRAAELDEIMARNGVGDLTVETEGRTVAAVAQEALARVGWSKTPVDADSAGTSA